MPEGAEVKRCSEMLARAILGEIVVAAEPVSGKLHRKGIPGIESLKLPSTVDEVTTKGKVIFVRLGAQYLVSTLGMSGWWYPEKISDSEGRETVYVNGKARLTGEIISDAARYARFKLVLENGTHAFYSDVRNFGNIYVTDGAGAAQKRSSLGIDLLKSFDIEEAAYAMTRPRVAKKDLGEALLDQSVLSGIGNIYRAEALYLSGLSPFRQVASLSSQELVRLIETAAYVLFAGYAGRGVPTYEMTRIYKNLAGHRDRIINAFGDIERLSKGKWRGHLVYSQVSDMLGFPVVSASSAGRTIWWVPEVQK